MTRKQQLISYTTMILILIGTIGCMPLLDPTPTSTEATVEPTMIPISTPTQEITSAPVTEVATEMPTLTSTPELNRSLLLAPSVPKVSAVIGKENAHLLIRLSSLGEGDLLNLCLSPNQKHLLVGTSNGILIVDPLSFEKEMFLPTIMPVEKIEFIDNGTKLTATDGRYGHIWNFPDGTEILKLEFPSIKTVDPNNYTNLIPSQNFESVFSEQHQHSWLGPYLGVKFSYSNSIAGILRTSDDSVKYMVPHKINSFSVSPGNQYLAYGTEEHQLILTNYTDGTVVQSVQQEGINSLQFSPDGKFLLGTLDNQVRVWSIPDLSLIGSTTAYETNKISFSPDNSLLAIFSKDTVRIMRFPDLLLINSYSGVAVTFSSDSKKFIINSGHGRVSLYELNDKGSNAVLFSAYIGSGIKNATWFQPINAGVLSSDDNQLLVVRTSGVQYHDVAEEIIVYDTENNTSVGFPIEDPHINDVIDALWLPGLQSYGLIICNFDGNCHLAILNLKTNSIDKYYNKDTYWGYYSELKFSNNGDLLISAQGNNFVHAWDIKNSGYWPVSFKERDFELRGHPNLSISFSPDDTHFYYSDPYNANYLIDTIYFDAIQVSDQGRYFYIADDIIGFTDGREILVHKISSTDVIYRLPLENIGVDYNQSRKMFAVVSNTGIRVWSLSNSDSEKFLFTMKGKFGDEVVLSPNGNYVAVLDEEKYNDKKVNILNLQDGSVMLQLGGGYSSSYTFSADSNLIAVSTWGSFGSSFSIIHLSSGETVFSSEGYICEGGSAPKLASSPDGKYLAVLCSYGYPQIWGIP